MASSPEPRPAATAAAARVLETIERSPFGATIPADARAEARANALVLLDACGATAAGLTIATVGYAAELLSPIADDLAADPLGTRRLIDELQTRAAVPRVALGRELLRPGGPLALVGDTAIEVHLELLLAFTGVAAVGLWTRDGDGAPTPVAMVGEPDGAHARAATAVLTDDRGGLVAGERSLGLSLDAFRLGLDAVRPPAVALIAHRLDPAASPPGPLLIAAAPTLAGLLDRRRLPDRQPSPSPTPAPDRQLLPGGQPSPAPAPGAVERRLARLRFDLHDGPQQDVHLLAQDLRLFREQLRPMIVGDPDRDRALGRLDDLEAQLVALDGDLRRLATSVQSPLLDTGSLPQALAQLADAFAERTGIRPRTEVSGDLTQLSDSQQITLLSLIREALSNIRKHSDAQAVSIAITSQRSGVRVEISDDGHGFDPQTTLGRAASAGRLGLVGMHERVRMLGGRTEIDSRPGGPTLVSATLPRWPAPGL